MLGRIMDTQPDDVRGQLEMLILKMRYKEGETFKSPSNKPLLLNDPDSVWIILQGRADIFSAPMDRNAILGPRQHLFRTQASSLLMGVAQGDSPLGFVAVGTGDTEIMHLPKEKFLELADAPETRKLASVLLNDWIANLYLALVQIVPPKEFIHLEPGKTTTLKLDNVARSIKNLVWVKVLDGDLRYLGRTEGGALDPAVPFPITGAGWLQAARGSKVESLETETILTRDGGWDFVDAFHRFVLREINHRARAADEREKARLKNRFKADSARVEAALNQLAAPLSEGGAAVFSEVDAEDPLLAACQLVGRELSIEVRPHPDMLRGKKLRNPLADLAKASRFRVRQVALKGEWWKSDGGPMLGYWEDGKRPVALIPTGVGAYVVKDPAERKTIPVTPDVSDNLSYFAYTFYRPFPERQLTGWDLLRFAFRDVWGDVSSIILMGLLMGALATATPVITGIVFQEVIPGSDRGGLVELGIVLLMIFLAAGAFQITRSIAILRLETRVGNILQTALWDRVLALPTWFFRGYSSGDLAARIFSLDVIRETITGPAINSILGGIFSLFNLIVLFAFDSSVAFTAVVLVLIAVIITGIFGSLQVRAQREVSTFQGRISGLILQIVTGIAKFRIAGAENRAFALWARDFSEQKKRSFRARMLRNYFVTFTSTFPVLATLVIFSAASGVSKDTSTGGFIAFYSAFVMFLGSALEFSLTFVSLFALVPYYERMTPVIKSNPEVDSSKSDPSELTGDIEVSHVTFRYKADGPQILRNVSFQINPGEFVALVGASGSGKSTLLRLLLGFELPESGAIFYNGQDLAGLDVRAVRRQMGVVLQSSQLMSGSIFENIVGQTGLTIDDAWQAAKMAGLEEDIKTMPMAMHTIVGEGGSTFSGGQRQRLLIARAVVMRPRILFFDEATSALDNRTQEIVSRSLEQLEATRVVIAHRLSTIINADRIIVMDKGELVQMGTYKELMAQPGLFADLAKRQLV